MTTQDAASSTETPSTNPCSSQRGALSSGGNRVNIAAGKAGDVVLKKQESSGVDDLSGKERHARIEEYSDFPLLQSMLRYEKQRTDFLTQEGRCQSNKSTSGWVRTLFIARARALDWVFLPWCFVVLHAALYAMLEHHYEVGFKSDSLDDWRSLFTFALNTTLGFLLVFRLNRAAARFWLARQLWGTIVACTRNLTSSLLVHSSHNSQHRDEAIRWIAAFPLLCKDFLRGEVRYEFEGYRGLLSKSQLNRCEQNVHPPLYCVFRIRTHLKQIFGVSEDINPSLAVARTQQMKHLEETLDTMATACGSSERIKGTPLPIVYVSHLRTFLLINLLLLPYIWGSDWGWFSIPIVAVAGFAYLGLEAAAAEVEAPFRKDRENALDMDGYAKTALAGILQHCLNHADASLGLDPMIPEEKEPEESPQEEP